MNQTVMLAVLVTLGVTLVGGLIAISAIEQQALANKGGVPNQHASDTAFAHAHGTRGTGGGCLTCGGSSTIGGGGGGGGGAGFGGAIFNHQGAF